MRSDSQRSIPHRLSVFKPVSFENDKAVKTISENLGAKFISTRDILCNERGCLVRLGDTARDIIQPDTLHLSVTGSRYLVSRIADKVFEGVSAPETHAENDDRKSKN